MEASGEEGVKYLVPPPSLPLVEESVSWPCIIEAEIFSSSFVPTRLGNVGFSDYSHLS